MNFVKVINDATPMLLQGVAMTVLISVVSIVIGLVIGFLTCLMGLSKSRILKIISGAYVWVIRGTPMMVQGMLFYLGVPQIVRLFIPDFRISAELASLITLSLNSGAYLSECFRGGISAVDIGQTEASRSLGLSKSRTMMKVVLPQAIKIAIPSMVNQFIITIKDSSILSVIALGELMNKAKVYVGSSYRYFETYLLVAVYYLIVISILMIISKRIEKRLRYESKDNR